MELQSSNWDNDIHNCRLDDRYIAIMRKINETAATLSRTDTILMYRDIRDTMTNRLRHAQPRKKFLGIF